MDSFALDPDQIQNDPALEGALNAQRELQILPYAFWRGFNQQEISAFCVQHGIYCVPTQELVDFLKHEMAADIAADAAIEIGSGNGALARALGIPATDNRMQEHRQYRAIYAELRQAPVRYGDHVVRLPAAEAVSKYQPRTVLAAWVTHKYNPQEHFRGGNMIGVDEAEIARVARYIFVGHQRVHRHKPLLSAPHAMYKYPWLVSRSLDPELNFIGVWENRP